MLRKLTDVIKEYLVNQIEAGVNAVMIFDSWAAALEESKYFEFSWDYMVEIAEYIKEKYPHIVVMMFPKGIAGFLDKIYGNFDVFGVDWSTPMALANEFKRIGWEVEFVSIGSNGTGKYHDRDLQLWIQQDTPSNIVLFMDWGRFDSKWLDRTLKPNTYWIQESGDDPQNFERNYPKSERFNLTLSPDFESGCGRRSCGHSSPVFW